jgi:hypothetical protein
MKIKHSKTFFVLALTTIFIFPGLQVPIGGKIISTTTPGVTCAGYNTSPATFQPVTMSAPGPYLFQLTAQRYDYGIVQPNVWFLGLMSPILDTVSCYTDSAPPLVFSTIPIQMFGTSLIGF